MSRYHVLIQVMRTFPPFGSFGAFWSSGELGGKKKNPQSCRVLGLLECRTQVAILERLLENQDQKKVVGVEDRGRGHKQRTTGSL